MKVGFIDYFLDEWHANNYPTWIKEHSNGEMEVAYAYGKIASPHSGMTSEAWCKEHGVTLCDTIDEVVVLPCVPATATVFAKPRESRPSSFARSISGMPRCLAATSSGLSSETAAV